APPLPFPTQSRGVDASGAPGRAQTRSCGAAPAREQAAPLVPRRRGSEVLREAPPPGTRARWQCPHPEGGPAAGSYLLSTLSWVGALVTWTRPKPSPASSAPLGAGEMAVW